MAETGSPIGEVYSGQTYLTLNAGGEGVFCVDGEAAAVEWETSGGRLTLTMGSARCRRNDRRKHGHHRLF